MYTILGIVLLALIVLGAEVIAFYDGELGATVGVIDFLFGAVMFLGGIITNHPIIIVGIIASGYGLFLMIKHYRYYL